MQLLDQVLEKVGQLESSRKFRKVTEYVSECDAKSLQQEICENTSLLLLGMLPKLIHFSPSALLVKSF